MRILPLLLGLLLGAPAFAEQVPVRVLHISCSDGSQPALGLTYKVGDILSEDRERIDTNREPSTGKIVLKEIMMDDGYGRGMQNVCPKFTYLFTEVTLEGPQ
jgi:hypothetical protein